MLTTRGITESNAKSYVLFAVGLAVLPISYYHFDLALVSLSMWRETPLSLALLATIAMVAGITAAISIGVSSGMVVLGGPAHKARHALAFIGGITLVLFADGVARLPLVNWMVSDLTGANAASVAALVVMGPFLAVIALFGIHGMASAGRVSTPARVSTVIVSIYLLVSSIAPAFVSFFFLSGYFAAPPGIEVVFPLSVFLQLTVDMSGAWGLYSAGRTPRLE